MRGIFLLVSLLLNFLVKIGYTQNLVPNPSFEDTISCPSGLNELHTCQSWLNFGFSPDYFNVCGPSGMSPPNTVFTYQNPHSGGAFTGILTYVIPGALGGPNWHEIIGAQLTNSLIPGTKYFVSFYANYANNINFGIASNNIGVKLSTVTYSSTFPAPFDGKTALNMNQILTDSLNWTLITGSFIADSNYQFISIGNFFDDSLTDTSNLYFNANSAYYLIDDVCLSTDSLYCHTWTGIDSRYINNVNYFPNPFINQITVNQIHSEPGEIIIYNTIGQRIPISYYYLDKQYFITFNNFIPSGLYYLRIRYKNNEVIKKIVHHS